MKKLPILPPQSALVTSCCTPQSRSRFPAGILGNLRLRHVVRNRESARQHHALHRHERRHARAHRRPAVRHRRGEEETEVRQLARDHRRELERRGAVKLRAIAVAREQTLDIANLERHLHQREGEEQVKVLKLVEPLLGLPSVETQQRHRGVDVLVERVVVAVNVIAETWWWYLHIRLDPPIRSSVMPSALFTHTLGDIAPWLPQCWIVSPIHAPARPSTDPATIPGMLKYSVCIAPQSQGWSPPRVAARAVHRLTLLRKELLAHALADGVVQGESFGRGDLGTASTGKILEDGQASEPRVRNFGAEVVGLDEGGAVAADGEV